MKLCFRYCLALLALITATSLAQNPVDFADANLKAAVEAELGVTAPTPSDMLDLDSLHAQSSGIRDLTGLEFANNLTELGLRDNQISDISALSGLTSLEVLWLDDNEISDITPLAGLSKLKCLFMSFNQITDVISLSGLSELEVCWIMCNKVTDIAPLAGLTNLTDLFLTCNEITDITPLGGLIELRELGLDSNKISHLSPLASLSNLEFLGVGHNQITDITPLPSFSKLRTLYLEHNRISDISPLSNMTNLRYLRMNSNPLNPEAYQTYIPQIESNNPGIKLSYDDPLWRTLTIESTPGGSVVIPGEGEFQYLNGTSVAIEAEPNGREHVFIGWSGSAVTDGLVEDPNAASTSVTVSRDHTLAAVFAEEEANGRVLKALCVISDFADVVLEDYAGDSRAINSEGELESMLSDMQEHWQWMSVNTEKMVWDIVRIQLDEAFSATAFSGWPEYRNAVVLKAKEIVEAGDYDSDEDGIMDVVWVIAPADNDLHDYLIGGASQNEGARVFVDNQASTSIIRGAIGNFNHEVGHNRFLPDLYDGDGDAVNWDNLKYLTLMSDSWPVPPFGFSAWERMQLDWLDPVVVTQSTDGISLKPAEEHLEAVLIPTDVPTEYFVIEYRRKPSIDFGSAIETDYNGLAVYHINEHRWDDGNNTVKNPLIRLEPADGSVQYGQSPEEEDFLYPENPRLPDPFRVSSYYAPDTDIFSIGNVQRSGNSIQFDITLHSHDPYADEFLFFDFEGGSDGWLDESDIGIGQLQWEEGKGLAGSNCVSISIDDATSGDYARWIMNASDLIVGKEYIVSAWTKAERAAPLNPESPAISISLEDRAASSRIGMGLGTFDWRQVSFHFLAGSDTHTLNLALGASGQPATGTVWFDDVSIVEVLRTETAFSGFLNGGFENGVSSEIDHWYGDAWRPSYAVYTWEEVGTGRNGSRCMSVENIEENDARILQDVSGLTVGEEYRLSGWIKGENIMNISGNTGATLGIFGSYDTTGDGLGGTFDWQFVDMTFTADATTVQISCRLGHWGSTVTGKAWFDDLTVTEVD